MNWRQALLNFYGSFGLSVYPEESVLKDVKFPWLTYSMNKGDFDTKTSVVLHLHFYTESEKIPNEKADEICNAIRTSSPIISNDGVLVLETGSPEWYSVPDQSDMMHKHRIINIDIQWMTRR